MRFTGFLGLIALAGSVVPGLTGGQEASAALAPAGCTGPFTQVASPSPGLTDNILFGASAAGAHDLWAVGRQSISGVHGGLQNLILFDSGHGWSQVASPDPGPVQSVLTSVSASGSDAWAAGWYDTGSSAKPFAPQALHWDGASWTSVPLPALPRELDTGAGPGIVDISPADAWLAGAWLGAGGTDKPVLAHWDGTAWSLVTPPAGLVALTAVAASGPGDVWAIGVGRGPAFPAVIVHYNGSAWRKSATLPGVHLNGVTSISRAEAWAVGTSNGGKSTATAEWNGSAWHVVPSPNPSTLQNGLSAVSGTASGGVWAVGSEVDVQYGVNFGEPEPMAMHWDGAAWTAVPATGTVPAPPTGDAFSTGTFLGVATPTASRVVAFGFGHGQSQSLVADLCPFAVRDTGFAPSVANLSGAGAAAYWVFPASDTASHELADGTGFGLFDSGTKAPGSTYAVAFPASGTYTVTDRSDGASEKIRVPIELVANSSGRIELRWASQAPPAGARFELQGMAPGSTKFRQWRATTKTLGGSRRVLPAGTYKFRSRMRNPVTGVATGWSPTLTVIVP